MTLTPTRKVISLIGKPIVGRIKSGKPLPLRVRLTSLSFLPCLLSPSFILLQVEFLILNIKTVGHRPGTKSQGRTLV